MTVRVRAADDREVEVADATRDHPLLGPARAISVDGRAVAWCADVDFARPGWIPALDRPAALPPGAGTALLNVLARAATGPLRYRGPYPTGSLFDALLDCFRVDDPLSAFGTFNAGIDASVAPVPREPPVDFHPAPFERTHHGPVVVQRRESVERVWVGGLPFGRAEPNRRVVDVSDGAAAQLWLGGVAVGEVVRVGALPGPVAEAPSADRAPVSPALRALLTERLLARSPAWAREPTAAACAGPWWFGDAGWDAARCDAHGIFLHAAWPEVVRAAPTALDDLWRALERAVHRHVQRG